MTQGRYQQKDQRRQMQQKNAFSKKKSTSVEQKKKLHFKHFSFALAPMRIFVMMVDSVKQDELIFPTLTAKVSCTGYYWSVGNELWALVVAQLVWQSIPTPDIRGSNPDIGEILSTNCTLVKTKIKKKRSGRPSLKSLMSWHWDRGTLLALCKMLVALPVN